MHLLLMPAAGCVTLIPSAAVSTSLRNEYLIPLMVDEGKAASCNTAHIICQEVKDKQALKLYAINAHGSVLFPFVSLLTNCLRSVIM